VSPALALEHALTAQVKGPKGTVSQTRASKNRDSLILRRKLGASPNCVPCLGKGVLIVPADETARESSMLASGEVIIGEYTWGSNG